MGGDCSLDVVQSVQGRLVDMMAQHKEDKDPEPLVLSKGALDMVLSISGVEEEHREAFSQRFEEAFGENARVSPQNLVDKKRLEVCTPEVKIQVPQSGGTWWRPALSTGWDISSSGPRAAWRSTGCRCGWPGSRTRRSKLLSEKQDRETG